jgi:error-prone DNA polymerase
MATFRKRGTIGLLEEKMVQQMVARGYDQAFAARCFNQIKGFGEYGFPESHAASFALLVYVSAWLKCRYPEVFAAALLNSQPMGFYAPAQIVRDCREHGVTVLPADVSHSNWDCTLEPSLTGQTYSPPPPCGEGFGVGVESRRVGINNVRELAASRRPPTGFPLRLGLRQVDGLEQAEAEKLVAARTLRRPHAGPLNAHPFASLSDLMAASGLKRASLDKLTAADAVRSLNLDRREALWEASALSQQAELPLFAWSETQTAGPEPAVALPQMPLCEHVVHDYQTLRLSLKAHPMSFLRAQLDAHRSTRVIPASGLANMKDGARVSIAGVVLVRQRPGSAKGVVFMTIEDETGVANAVVWPKTLERYRRVVMGARLILIHGRIQRHEQIIHIVTERLEDRSDWLALLADGAELMKIPIARADEVLHPGPDPGSATPGVHPRFADRPRSHHPRNARIIPKSRDFH